MEGKEVVFEGKLPVGRNAVEVEGKGKIDVSAGNGYGDVVGLHNPFSIRHDGEFEPTEVRMLFDNRLFGAEQPSDLEQPPIPEPERVGNI